jgi:hypothetical protein
LKTFLRPWLAVQTRYNELALDALEALQNELTDLAARLESNGAHTERVASPATPNTSVAGSKPDEKR